MFEKFQQAVKEAYLDLEKNKKLDFSRELPTTGDLKNWSIHCFEKGLLPSDEAVFADYFREKNEKKLQKQLGKSLREIVKDSETDKFRALRNFIIGDTKRNPDRDVVKFLAVLINFQPRPYDFKYWNSFQQETMNSNKPELPQNEETNNSISNDLMNPERGSDAIVIKENDNSHSTAINEDKNKLETEEGTLTENDKTSVPEELDKEEKIAIRPEERSFFEKNKYTLRFTGVASFIVAIFITIHFLTPKDCMCWNGEKYIQVDCQDKTQAYQVIGLDQDRLKHFRKITQSDILGVKDIGNIWYSKIDNEVEFFTGPGYHPVRLNKSLKAVTKHIWDTYVSITPDSNQHVKFGIMQKQKE